MYPHLHVRPVIGKEEVALLGHSPFTPAATITFGKSRQSRRALMRERDKAMLRWEDWEKREASAQPQLMGSFPVFGANSTKSFNLVGANPEGLELREYQIVWEVTITEGGAGVATIAAIDHNVLAVSLLTKLRWSLYGQGDVGNLSSVEDRAIAVLADGRDPFTQAPGLRIGATITQGGNIVTKLKMKIPFCYRGLEVPEIFSPSTNQANLTGSKIDLDTGANGSITFGGRTCTVVVNDVKVYLVGNVVPVLHAGPAMWWKNRQIAASVDLEPGQGVDLFVGTEEAPASTRVQQWSVFLDGRPGPFNIDPVTLAQQYGESIFTMDGLLPLDITSNSTGAQLGAQLTPLIWPDGRIRSGAWQWPTFTSSRKLLANLVSGQSAVINLLYWQVRPIYEVSGQIVNLATQAGLNIKDVDSLMVRGGNDGEVFKQFKGRFMRLRKVAQKAA